MAAICCLGVVLRLAMLDRLAVEHFDEGVYASNLWFGAEAGFAYPGRHFFAPPLAPLLMELSMAMFGMTDLAAMAPSLALGSATPVLIWWLGRRAFGAAAGAGACLLAAVSEPHILYTRSALTDAMLTFWLSLAVLLALEMLIAARGTASGGRVLVLGLGAGVATGLAWATKYNGWLPLAIAASGGVGWAVFERPPARTLLRASLGAAAMAIMAIAIFAWAISSLPVEYGEIAANHRQYFGGLSGWGEALLRQALSLCALDGLPTRMSLAGALLLVMAMQRGGRGDGKLWALGPGAAALGALAAGAFLGASLIAGVAAAVYYLWRLVGGRKSPDGMTDRLGVWLASAWFFGLLVAIPLYRPYPRLTMPWLPAAWIGASGGLSLLAGLVLKPPGTRPALALRGVVAGAALTIGIAITAPLFPAGRVLLGNTTTQLSAGWPNRRGMLQIAQGIADDAAKLAQESGRAEGACLVLVYGEPALFYQLHAAGVAAAPVAQVPEERLGGNGAPLVFLAAGAHAERSSSFQEEFAEKATGFDEVGEYTYSPSQLVWLDNYSPDSSGVQEKVRLYRLRTR